MPLHNDSSTLITNSFDNRGFQTASALSSSKSYNFYDDKGNVFNTATLTADTNIDLLDICKVFGFDSEVPLEMPNSKTYLYEKDGVLKIGVYKDGKLHKIGSLLPAIEDVQIIEGRVVIVSFADGTKEKAALNEDDSFSFELGISICLTKKLLSMKTCGNGSSVYNKLIDYCIGVYHKRRNKEFEAECEAKRKAQIHENHKKKADKKKEKKAQAEREAQIEIYKEAYLRALKEFKGTSAE